MDGELIMRKLIGWTLLASALGCGQSDTSTPHGQVGSTQAAPVTSPTTAPKTAGIEPKRISPEEAVSLAKELIQNRNFNDASKLLNEAIVANPKLVEAYTIRASILADAKLFRRAIRDLDRAIELDPDNARYRNTRGYFHLMLQDDGPAMEDFNEAIALDPNYAQPFNNRGLVRISLAGYYRQQEDFERAGTELKKAVGEFDVALRIDKAYVDAHNNRGFALLQAKKYDEAIASFSQAIELNDKYVNAWNNRGQAQALAGRHEQAINDLTRAIELQPGSLEFFELRAQSYKATEQLALARQDLDHVQWSLELDVLNRQLNSDPKNSQHWIARGDHLQKEARWEDAFKNYTDALVLAPDSLEAVIGQASVLFHQGKLDEALAACNSVLTREAHRDAYSLRGDIHARQGKYDDAIADYKMAQRFDSGVAQTYLRRSEQKQAAGDIQQASADMIQAAKMDPRLKNQLSSQPDDDTSPATAPAAFPIEAIEAAPLTPVPTKAVEPISNPSLSNEPSVP